MWRDHCTKRCSRDTLESRQRERSGGSPACGPDHFVQGPASENFGPDHFVQWTVHDATPCSTPALRDPVGPTLVYRKHGVPLLHGRTAPIIFFSTSQTASQPQAFAFGQGNQVLDLDPTFENVVLNGTHAAGVPEVQWTVHDATPSSDVGPTPVYRKLGTHQEGRGERFFGGGGVPPPAARAGGGPESRWSPAENSLVSGGENALARRPLERRGAQHPPLVVPSPPVQHPAVAPGDWGLTGEGGLLPSSAPVPSTTASSSSFSDRIIPAPRSVQLLKTTPRSVQLRTSNTTQHGSHHGATEERRGLHRTTSEPSQMHVGAWSSLQTDKNSLRKSEPARRFGVLPPTLWEDEEDLVLCAEEEGDPVSIEETFLSSLGGGNRWAGGAASRSEESSRGYGSSDDPIRTMQRQLLSGLKEQQGNVRDSLTSNTSNSALLVHFQV